ncbi:MAG: hypothetical protein GPJ54_22270 [Candidatus Heimdallarchaeota archaeon]|nr:hypothetical protein [Candidatus Heimdallarchaeota archaeon]
MFQLFRSRKAQIRGIDFSLSIIIFSLTIGQILLLTNTFIDGNRSQVDFEERLEFVDSLASQLVLNTGYGQGTENWAATSSAILNADQNWILGLSTAGSIDPYKVGRLSNNSISDLEIDYLLAQKGLNLSKDLRLEITNPIDVKITSATAISDLYRVEGTASKSEKPLFGVKIWIYIVAPDGSVQENYTTSDSNGSFLVQGSVALANENYFVGVIARFGHNSEDIDISNIQNGVSVPTKGRISIQNTTNFVNGNAVNITAELPTPNTSTINIITMFPVNPGQDNYTLQPLTSPISNMWVNDATTIPTSGSVLFLATGLDLGGNGFLAYVDFPLSLDGSISEVIEPVKIPSSDSSSRFISIMVRGILLNVVITIWE